jgi:hypothetical protein
VRSWNISYFGSGALDGAKIVFSFLPCQWTECDNGGTVCDGEVRERAC